jgi:hypothetical protein
MNFIQITGKKKINSRLRHGMSYKLPIPFCLIIFTFLLSISVSAQEKPPKPITVTVSTAQHLSFGTIIQTGVSGTVSVSYQGIRSSTGSIIIPSISSSAQITPAMFIVTSLPGALIAIDNIAPTTLLGSNGGTVDLSFNLSTDCRHGTSFVALTGTTNVYLGGKLTVGPLTFAKPGDYSGTFTVTFIQQ